jgi:acyl-coenzyme A synthetase/AMP-(fatty) acid ligase
MYLIDMIFYWAKADPQRLALIQPELIITYRALADAIESIAQRVEQLKLDRQEPVGVSIANPSFFAATVFGVLHSGHSAALARPALLPLLQAAGIRNLIYDSQGLVMSGGRNIRFDPAWITGAQQSPVPKPAHEPSPDITNLDVIFFTSGTTGLPKKVVQPLSAVDQLLKYPLTCVSGPGEKILIMPGLSTSLGFNRLCETLNAGKSACFAADSEAALSLIALHRIDVAVASAAQALAFSRLKNANPDYRVDSLKALFVAGGKVDPEGIANIRATICRNLLNQYGSTEAGVAALTPFDALDNQSAAIPLPWTELQIVDEANNPLPRDTEGLIRYRTPQLAANIKRSGANAIPGVRGDWFYPGDIGTLGANGVLSLGGRTSDVINRGGVKVSGTRIEEILRTLPQVKDAAACGVAGASGMEEVWIAIVPDGPLDVEDIRNLLRTHADVGLAPDEIFMLNELPRGELGKVQKVRLRELLLARKKVA